MSRSQRPVWLGEDKRGWDHARIHRQLLEDDRIGVYELGIYVGLAIHAETMTGSCRPAATTLARYVKCGERRAREALDRLEAAGYIEVDECVGKASTYRLLPPPTLAPGARVERADPGTTITDPGTTDRGTPAPGADEQEPVEREPVNEGPLRPPTRSVTRSSREHGAPAALSVEQQFEIFWIQYPTRAGRKLEKAKALERWRRLKIDERRLAVKAARHYAAECDAGVRPAKDAFRWLRDRLWLEWAEPGAVPGGPGPGRPHGPSTSDFQDLATRLEGGDDVVAEPS